MVCDKKSLEVQLIKEVDVKDFLKSKIKSKIKGEKNEK